jgi:hypothetical protein
MARKKRRNMHKAVTYGVRDKQCPRCKLLLRKEDFTGDLCNWCVYELTLPARTIAARMKPITRRPAAPR